MKGRILYSCLLIWLLIAGLSTYSSAQTISNVTFTPTTVCPGSNVTVTFATSTTFAAGNVFTAYLSDAAGSAYSTTIGTVTSRTGTGVSINATIPAGTGNGSGYKIQVKATNNTFANSAATLTVSLPTAPGVTPPTSAYCEGDAAPVLIATASAGGTLNWYGTSSTGGTKSSTPTTPFTTADYIGDRFYYVSQTVGSCEGPRASIKVTVNNKPNAPSATSPQTRCANDGVRNLTASLSDGGTQLNWYTVSTGGAKLSATPQPTTNGTFYVSQTNASGCESDRTAVVFQITPLPAAPTVASTGPTYCQGTPTDFLSATPTGTNTLLWWGTSSSGGTSSTTAPRPDNQNSATYYVGQRTSDGCVGTSRASISITIVPIPSEPIVKGPSPVCSGSPVGALTATATSNDYELRWWGTSQTGGSSTTTAPPVNNTQSATYYVTQVSKIGGCSSSPRTPISVIINPLPPTPTISDPGVFCQSRASRQLQANASSGATLKWFDANNNQLPGAPSPPTNNTGSFVYYVSQSYDATGCTSASRATITVNVNKTPDRPSFTTPPVYCAGQTADLLAASTTGFLTWYGRDSTSSGSSSATRPQTDASSNYYVSQTVNGCRSNIQTIPVQVKTTPAPPSVTQQDLSFCQYYDAVTLGATASNGAKLNWWGESSSGGNRSDNAPAVPNNVDKTYSYYVSQTLDGCESGLGGPSGRTVIRVRVKTTPGAPGVSPLGLCNNQQTQQLTANGTNIKWFDASNNPLSEAPKPPTNNVGDQVYKASQTSAEGCESKEKATLVVTIKPLPNAPGVSSVTLCQAQQDQPSQGIGTLKADGQNLKWFFPDGNLLPNAPVPSIDKAGTTSYFVTQTVNGCEGGKSELKVWIITPPLPMLPKSLVTYCINDKAVPLEASGEPGSKLQWVDPYGRTSTDAPIPSTLNTNVQPSGDPFYVYQVASYGCVSARATIRIIVNTTPTLSLAAPTPSVNLGLRAPLQLKFTGAGPYSYTLTEGYSGTARSDTTIRVLPRGNTSYQVTTVSNGCGTGLPGNPVTISVRVPTVSTSSLTTSTLCAGTSLTVPFTTTGEFNPGNAFRIEMVSVADTAKKFAVPTTANGSPVTSSLPITLPSGQYYVRVKADNPEIAILGSNSPTLLTIRSLPTATLTGTQNIYEGTPVNLTFTFGGDGPWDAIYADSLRTYPLTATTSPLVVEARPARTTTYRLTSVTNSCGSGALSGTAVITVLPLLGVDDNSLDPLVKAYPVPTETTLMVELNLPLTREPAKLMLTDLHGQPVIEHTTRSQKNELNLTAQPSGVYILRIQVGDRQTVRKVLKQ